MSEPFQFRTGEPIAIALSARSGDPAGFAVRARIKAAAGPTPPPADAPLLGEFEVSFIPATDTIRAHWLLTLPDDVAAGLLPGFYAIDAAVSLDGMPIKVTRPRFMILSASVSDTP